jgi:nicotinate-nucleotide pyrophosphorylase (carboxylating)
MFLPRKILEKRLLRMLAEDVGQGDVTTGILVPPNTNAKAEIVAKDSGVIAGIEEARTLLECLGLEVEALVEDGKEVKARYVLMRVSGDARTMLSAERTILNMLSRMSGIATATRKLTEKLQRAKLKTRIACTRKSAPGLLYFDKKAVLIGGGDTHRLHLDDMILIKDNHIAVVGGVQKAVKAAKERASLSKKIEVEVTRTQDVLVAAKAGADVIMLDNFTPEQVREACNLLKKSNLYGRVLLEASGGITADNVLDFANSGVDLVSLGEITHSVKALNINLEITKVGKQLNHQRL